jgi:DNA-binding FadR family transcriptional regulator
MRLLSGDARRAVFAPLDEGVVRSEAVVRRLGSAIALGLIVDGEQLPAEANLATSLNVSTMTLRDALADLRARGLVETRRGRAGGSFVRTRDEALAGLPQVRLEELGTSELRELGDVHVAVAGTAARLAARRASPLEVTRLREIVDRLAGATDLTDKRRLDARYFVELAACTQSVRLTMAEIDLQTEMGQIPWPAGGSGKRLRRVVEGHALVVQAVEERDEDLARSRMEEHLTTRTAWLVDLHLKAATAGNRRDETGLAPRRRTRGARVAAR